MHADAGAGGTTLGVVPGAITSTTTAVQGAAPPRATVSRATVSRATVSRATVSRATVSRATVSRATVPVAGQAGPA